MINIRKAAERGLSNLGWLDSRHTFSFADYYDPQHMGFRTLRVINDDRVAGGAGFDTHPHRDMEIISYVVSGALEHRDSMGHGSVIRAGDVQVMTAGSGITHSEFNPDPAHAGRFLQIWIVPEKRGLQPRYDQKTFPAADKINRLQLIVSRDGRDGSLSIHQNAAIFAGLLDAGTQLRHMVSPDRHVWLQVVTGKLELNGMALAEGDGAAMSAEQALAIHGISQAEFLVFDLA